MITIRRMKIESNFLHVFTTGKRCKLKRGDCVTFEIQQKIVRITPNSEHAHKILKEENRQPQRWINM
jgi:hypothetical protein